VMFSGWLFTACGHFLSSSHCSRAVSAAMPVASHAPASQPATFFSLQELAQASGVDLEACRQRVVELA
jgi:hypothetical protein